MTQAFDNPQKNPSSVENYEPLETLTQRRQKIVTKQTFCGILLRIIIERLQKLLFKASFSLVVVSSFTFHVVVNTAAMKRKISYEGTRYYMLSSES